MNKRQIKYIFSFIFVITLAGFTACEGPSGPEGPQGLQGEQGPEGPQGPQGVEGTANATLYIFDGHSFNSSSSTERDIELRNESEMFQSVWQVYLVQTTEHAGNSTSVIGVYPLPGRGYFVTDLGDTEYRFRIRWMPDESIARFTVLRDVFSGGGEPYDNIHIIRIAPGEVMGKQVHAQSYIPDNLDLSDYHAVMEHYGLKQQATKHKVENTGYAEWSYQLEQLKKLREAGFTTMELRERGYTAKELKEAGYEADELKEAGYTAEDIHGTYTADEIHGVYVVEELYESDFIVSEMKEGATRPWR